MTIIDRYVLRKHVGPFLFAIATITFIFIMRVLVDFLGLFASRDVGLWTIVEIITLSLGWIFALTFPMAVLVAVVMTFGRLSQDFELDALHAGGRSFLRTLAPVLAAGVVLTGLLVLYNNHVLPEANHRLKTLTADIRKMKPTIVIREGVFITDFPGYTMLVREVDDENSIIRDVTIYTLDPREPVKTIHAPWGELAYDAGGNQLVIRLHDGEMHEVDPDDPASYLLAEFKVHNLIFGDLGTRLERRAEGLSRSDRELSAAAMRGRVRSLEEDRAGQADSLAAIAEAAFAELRAQVTTALASPDAIRPAEFATRARVALRRLRAAERRVERADREIHRYQVEIHKKYSFPVACLVFIFLGAPIGARVRRGGLGVGGGLSFVFFLLYYVASLGGEKMGDRGFISPALGMWGIDIVLGLVGLLLVLRLDSRWPFSRGAALVSVLDRYLLRSLLVPLGGSIGVFLTLAIVVDLFEKLDTFLDHGVSMVLITRYYVATIPFLISLLLPVTVLISVLFALGGMARRNELIAMTAAGVSLYRILTPILVCGFAMSLIGLAFTTQLVPRGNTISSDIYDHEIKDRPRITGSSRRDLSYLGAGGRFFVIRHYDGDQGRMGEVVVQQFSEGTLVRRIDAEYALWDGTQWVFHNGYLRSFRNDSPPRVEPYTERTFDDIQEQPRDFLRPVKEPDEMTLRELSEHIARTDASGGDVRNLLVDRHTRYSFPFASFIVVLLGAPLTGAIRRGGHALGFGVALLVGFVYYILLQIGQTFGNNGSLPPIVAAWLPNGVFVLAGALGLVKTRK